MPKSIRVNVRTRVNNANIVREKRNGRNVIIVPSATLPDDIVMNRIKYPADEIEKSYRTLERTTAPLSHPKVNNKFVSATDPEALADYWVGAWNENVRRENGRVYLNKVIYEDVAQQTEKGRQLLEAVNEGKAIHTSTGIFLERVPVKNGGDHDYVARNMVFDHDAILLDEEGAATPEQGVGMMVNADGTTDDVEALNFDLPAAEGALPGSVEKMREALESALRDVYSGVWVQDFNATHVIFRAEVFDHEPRKVSYEATESGIAIGTDVQEVRSEITWRVVNKLAEMFKSFLPRGAAPGQQRGATPAVNASEGDEMDEATLKAALADHAKTMQANFDQQLDAKLGEKLGPLQAELDALKTNREAEETVRRTKAVEAVVNAGWMTKEVAAVTPLPALEELAANCQKPGGPAAPANPSDPATNSQGDEFAGYDLNSHLEGDK